jgi:hypothetical protein
MLGKARRKTESEVAHQVAEQAGWLLCTYAGQPYSWEGARHLAMAVRANRWYELTDRVARRLRTHSLEELLRLADDKKHCLQTPCFSGGIRVSRVSW